MYGVIVATLGGPEGLRYAELPDPVAGPGQVVVRVHAVCVHPADIAACAGAIPGGPVPPPCVLAHASHDDEGWVGSLGALEVIPRTLDLASIGPVPAVLDAVPLGEAAAAAVADGGVVVTTRPTPPIDPQRRVRQELQLIHLDRPLLADLVAQLASGELRTRVATAMPLSQAAEAHRLVAAGGLRGKIVLTTVE